MLRLLRRTTKRAIPRNNAKCNDRRRQVRDLTFNENAPVYGAAIQRQIEFVYDVPRAREERRDNENTARSETRSRGIPSLERPRRSDSEISAAAVIIRYPFDSTSDNRIGNAAGAARHSPFSSS